MLVVYLGGLGVAELIRWSSLSMVPVWMMMMMLVMMQMMMMMVIMMTMMMVMMMMMSDSVIHPLLLYMFGVRCSSCSADFNISS